MKTFHFEIKAEGRFILVKVPANSIEEAKQKLIDEYGAIETFHLIEVENNWY